MEVQFNNDYQQLQHIDLNLILQQHWSKLETYFQSYDQQSNGFVDQRELGHILREFLENQKLYISQTALSQFYTVLYEQYPPEVDKNQILIFKQLTLRQFKEIVQAWALQSNQTVSNFGTQLKATIESLKNDQYKLCADSEMPEIGELIENLCVLQNDYQQFESEQQLILLQKQLDSEKQRNQELQQKIVKTSHQNDQFVIFKQRHKMSQKNHKDKQQQNINREKEILINSLEREEEYMVNLLKQYMTIFAQQKVELENSYEYEQEFAINTISRQIASNLSDKIELQKRIESEMKSISSDVDSTKEYESDDFITDSSMSSDSESFPNPKKRFESELNHLRRQMKLAKHEALRYKNLYVHFAHSQSVLLDENPRQTRSEMGGDTDRSEEYQSGRLSVCSLNSSREFMTPDRR